MCQMRKHDSFIDCPKHVFFIMIGCKTHKSALGQRILVGTIQKWQKNNTGIPRINFFHPLVSKFIHRHTLLICLFFFIIHQTADKPLHISGRCGTALLHQIITGNTEHGIQSNTAIQYWFFLINSLMLQVPAIIHICSSSESPDAIPQAFT